MAQTKLATLDEDGQVPAAQLGNAADGRVPLRASSNRADGFWDPTVTQNFDNTDLSKVVLQIPTPGNWIVGWRGTVSSNAGFASMEADVYLSPAGQANPYAASELYPEDIDYYVAFNIIESSSNSVLYLRAMAQVVIPEPSQIAAQIYTNSGAMRVLQSAYLALPQLFAWPT